MSTLHDVLDHLHAVRLPEVASPICAPGRITISSGQTFDDWRVIVLADDETIRVHYGHGNGVEAGSATFAHVPASIIADAVVALCWTAAEEVAAR
jgi:hypothetical protein